MFPLQISVPNSFHSFISFNRPASITLYVTPEEADIVAHYINTHTLPSRLILLLYIHSQSDHFPINILRNIAIRNIETTHFLILDSDLLISSNCIWMLNQLDNAYEELLKIPSSISSSSSSAVIVPTFFYNPTVILPYCSSIEDCTSLYYFLWYHNTSSDLKAMPSNKKELIACLISGLCSPRKKYVRTHVWSFLHMNNE